MRERRTFMRNSHPRIPDFLYVLVCESYGEYEYFSKKTYWPLKDGSMPPALKRKLELHTHAKRRDGRKSFPVTWKVFKINFSDMELMYDT